MDARIADPWLQRVATAAPIVDGLRPQGTRTPDSDGDRKIRLTPFELRCLALLVRHRGQIVTKAMFLHELYPHGDEPEMKIIDVFICKLRRKLRLSGTADMIETIWGRGYVLR